MNKNYSYLQIAVAAWADNGNVSNATYNGADPVDTQTLSDLCRRFVNLDQAYLMTCNAGRRSFTLMLCDELAEHPRVAVRLTVDSEALLEGRRIMNLLTAVARHTPADLTDDTFAAIIKQSSMPAEPLRSPADITDTAAGATGACRTFMSSSELARQLSFCRQKEYAGCGFILFIPATVSMYPDRQLPVIAEPLSTRLIVVAPYGVTPSEPTVALTDRLSLTYTRDGFDSVKVEFEVGDTNRYVRISTPALVVNTASHAGIMFRTSVRYTVTDGVTGNSVPGFTLLINGRTASRSDDSFEITDRDFNAGEANITVSSTNYATWSLALKPSGLATLSPLDIRLMPDSGEFVLRLDFGGGRIIEHPLSIEKGTTEYSNLRAGNFHGFRAHRIAVSRPETYHIDLSAPAAVAESPKAALNPVNISRAEQPTDTDPSTGHDDDHHAPARRRKLSWRKIMLLVALLLLIAAAVWFIFFHTSGEKSPATTPDTEVSVTDTITAAAAPDTLPQPAPQPAQPAQPAQPDETADLAYLNASKVWRLDSLRSDRYRSLITTLTTGNLDSIARHPYFATPGAATNNRAIDIVEFIWAANGSDTQTGNSRYLRQLSADKPLDLETIYKDLAIRRPHNPNTSPRPGK